MLDSQDQPPLSPISDSDSQAPSYTTSLEDLDHDSWSQAFQRVIKAIVTIKVNVLRTFDTEEAGWTHGTGFVVDRINGIILSNRHLVTQAPITAIATFGNDEEINLKQDYADPVHDFGFFRYDPSKVKFADVEDIELYPQGAKIGMDIKVCGNDAGEKLSIHTATLSRLNRAAPMCGPGYNDFNINYFQAAAGTATGSSGSPVLDTQGHAIALNAAGHSDAATSFFLPLEPVVRALKLIQNGKAIPRGTLQTIFLHSSYDELKRVGFPESAERQSREQNKTGTGLLMVSKVLPEGPGYDAGIEVGDVLVECFEESFGRRFIDGFHSLWEVIDGSIGKEMNLTIYRGDERKDVIVLVQDLHSITPSTFVEACDGIFHPLSYQLALSYNIPCRGIFAADPGVFGLHISSDEFLITQLNGESTDSIDDFKTVLLSIADHQRVEFRFMTLGGCNEQVGLAGIDHHFFASAQFTRVDTNWKRHVLKPNPIFAPASLTRAPTFNIQGTSDEMFENILVMIHCRIPYPVDVNLFFRRSRTTQGNWCHRIYRKNAHDYRFSNNCSDLGL